MLDGKDITGKAGSVSYMLQKDLLFHYKTILENVALPLEIKGIKKSVAKRGLQATLGIWTRRYTR